MKEFTERIVKPMMLPLTAGIFIFIAVWSFSRILLAVPEVGSTALALLVSAEILGVCAVIAAAAKLKAAQKAITVVLGIALVGGGGAAAAIGEREIHHGDEAEFALTAENLLFTESQITVPAGEAFELTFANHDAGIPHNVAVYTDESASEALFAGEIFNGVETRVYEAPALDAGSYFFRCDVHPDTMTGTMNAGEGGPGPEPTGEPTDGPGATSFDIVAENIQFDTDTMVLAADTDVTIEFANNDTGVPHNVAIYPDETRTNPVFQGEVFNGVETRTYTVPPTPAGEYVFFCDVHPNMKGIAVFR